MDQRRVSDLPTTGGDAIESQRRMASLLRATLESTADGILVVDRTGRAIGFNRRFAEMWQIPDEILSRGDDAEMITHVLAQVRDPEAFQERIRALYAVPDDESRDFITFRDGRTYERYSRPQRLDDQIVGRVWSFRDMSAQRQAESALRDSQERLLQSQKMEIVGRLAGGVAHDFNNLLTIIGGNAQLLVDRLPEGHPLNRSARDILRASEHAAALTARLLAFSRRQVVERRGVDIHAVVRSSLALLRRLLREDIHLDVSLAPAAAWVLVDPVELEQVLLNLAVNARDAIPGSGALSISTRVDTERARVIVDVADTGSGMDEATLARAFEPFFTTKESGHGTGLGLATVKDVITTLGGGITVATRVGHGTTFTFHLPLQPAPADSGRTLTPTARQSAQGETVLVVEDAAELRALVRDVLVGAGYRVFEASEGREAVAVVGREDIDLMLTDVVLPRLSGPEAYAQARALRPSLHALFMSGYADVGPGLDTLPPGARRLAKPFRLTTLLLAVRDALRDPV